MKFGDGFIAADDAADDAGLENGSEELTVGTCCGLNCCCCCCLEPLEVAAKGSAPADECELLANGSNEGVVAVEEACLGDSANGSNEGVLCLGVLANGSNEGVAVVDARRG